MAESVGYEKSPSTVFRGVCRYVSYLALDDSVMFDIFDDSPTAPRLVVLEDDGDGPFVQVGWFRAGWR